jgi:hypothetical protein
MENGRRASGGVLDGDKSASFEKLFVSYSNLRSR